MPITKTWKKEEIKMRYLILVFIGIQFFSCNKENPSSQTYYYDILDSNNTVKGYFKRVVTYGENRRLDSVFRYNKAKELQNIRLEEYNIEKNILKSSNGEELLLLNSQDSCYVHYSKSNNEYKTCYLGKSKLSLNSKTYNGSHKFLVTEVITDGVSNYKYFDDDFILIRQEYADGFLKYYRIDRTKKIENLK